METSKQKKPGSWIFRSGHMFGERNPPAPDSCALFVSVDNRIPRPGRPETHQQVCPLHIQQETQPGTESETVLALYDDQFS